MAKRKPTNYEVIISKSVDEMAEYLHDLTFRGSFECPCEPYDFKECYKEDCDCQGLIKKWLEKKAD